VTFISGVLMRSRSTKSGDVKPLSALSHSRLRQIMFASASFASFRSSRDKAWVQPFLHHCLTLADALGLPTRLEHLRWNPVRSLYLRHGFADVGQSDIHIFMERPVTVP
jgi:hypothetical protein